jgi:hypothetical protein
MIDMGCAGMSRADVVNSGCHGDGYGMECMCHMWVTYGSAAGTGMACASAK